MKPADIKRQIWRLVDSIVQQNMPFSMFDKQSANLSSKHVGGKYLNTYYNRIHRLVVKNIEKALQAGFGTLVFDGWEDVNKCSVVNVMLKVETGIDSGRRIFFLDIIYTVHQRLTAEAYQSLVETTISKYVPDHSCICCVVSDNTSACAKSRKLYEERHPGVISVNDSTLIADFLMKELVKINWV